MDTKRKIIKVALRLFLEKGYDGASMTEISRESGVTKGGIYHHFESKEHLFREALSLITSQMESWSSSQFGGVRSAKDLLAALFGSVGQMKEVFAGIVGEGSEQHPYSFLEILVNAARRDPGVRREMQGIYARTRHNITMLLERAQDAGEIRPDIDCEALAFEINALMEGILLLSVLDEGINLGKAGDRLYRNMWSMIAK